MVRRKSERFTAGCGGRILTADYYNRQYPYDTNYFKPISANKTNLEGVPLTNLYTSLY